MKTFYPGQLIEYRQLGRLGSWYSGRYVRSSDRNGWHWVTQGMLDKPTEIPTRRIRALIRWEQTGRATTRRKD